MVSAGTPYMHINTSLKYAHVHDSLACMFMDHVHSCYLRMVEERPGHPGTGVTYCCEQLQCGGKSSSQN